MKKGTEKCQSCGAIIIPDSGNAPVTSSGIYGNVRIEWGTVAGSRTTERIAVVCLNCGEETPLKTRLGFVADGYNRPV